MKREMASKDKQGVTHRLFCCEKQKITNEVFYLDLPGFKGLKVIEQKIKANGGRVEHFFSQDVTCVITNGEQRKSPRRQMQAQQNMNNNKLMTRAQSILANSKQKQKSLQVKKDVTSTAQELGISVRHLDDLNFPGNKENIERKEGNERRILRRDPKQPGKKSAFVRKLRSPFIKIEDQSRSFQPLLNEMQEWPKIHWESLQPNCPFKPPSTKTQNDKRSRKGQSSSKSASTQKQKFKGQNAKITGQISSSKKIGYCELCNANYRGLKQHLKGTNHRNNATNSAAFNELDETIRRGTTASQYFESVKLRNQKVAKRTNNRSTNSIDSSRTPPKKSKINDQASPDLVVTPLTIVFSPGNGFSVIKAESSRKRKPGCIELEDDEVIINRTPKKRKIEDYSVIQLGELKLKIRRSTRLLRGSSSDKLGSVFLDFPTYKDGIHKDETSTMYPHILSHEDPIVCHKYGTVHGKMRLSTRIMDTEDHKGLEDFECPMYMETNNE